MTKDLLLRLYARKDRKRRKMLFALFRDKIKLNVSIDAVVEMINQELGKQGIINAADIKYCRHYFGKRHTENERQKLIADMYPGNNSNSLIMSKEVKTIQPDLEEVDWTDVDEISVAMEGIKSKFTKR
ncbi:hypothetical protein [Dyadobacter aurulentus]|uniref:hypothetical protein n=1 Tax=Dyadobacter sp. UC 10 TaxID=2605428 RepID=UPI0011F0C15A|nr:hypothetical protein [Dyadobacter sp. UC 10]KAA0990414.1 hypothetical protein FXO21_09715 [Dyadobacter sp. UC 10]